MSNIIVPEHLKEATITPTTPVKSKKKLKSVPPTEEKVDSVADAYVSEEHLFLNPTKIPKSAKEKMPKPTGWRILLLPYMGKRVTDGGIVLTDSQIEREQVATVCGYVLAVGPDAYKDANRYERPWCKEGDWIIFGRYAGSRFRIEGGEVRLLNDDEVLATITNPDDILHY
jgi:chaperonin GroES|tara:strand:+ start:994 stop:1506 length:513 start_codon:yes stop_codon:yes gene_type:complete